MALAFLNKKSWHTGGYKQIEAVWKKEQEKEAEDKKLAELRREVEERRKYEEFQKLQEDAGLAKRQDRVDFLYDPGLAVVSGKASAEEYLLGKKYEMPAEGNAVAQLGQVPGSLFLPEKAASKLAGGEAAGASSAGAPKPPLFSANEQWRRLHADPLLAIRQQEQAALARIRSNPVKMEAIAREVQARKGSGCDDGVGDEKRRRKEEKKAAKEEKKAAKRAAKEARREEAGRKEGKRHHGHKEGDAGGGGGADASSRHKCGAGEQHDHREGRADTKHVCAGEGRVDAGGAGGSIRTDRDATRSDAPTVAPPSVAAGQPYGLTLPGGAREGGGEGEPVRKRSRWEDPSGVAAMDVSREGHGLGRVGAATSGEGVKGRRREDCTSGGRGRGPGPTEVDVRQAGGAGGSSKLTEEEKAARLAAMMADADHHEEDRWRRIQKATERDAHIERSEGARRNAPGGTSFLEKEHKRAYGANNSASASVQESLNRRSYFVQRTGSTLGDASNAFRK